MTPLVKPRPGPRERMDLDTWENEGGANAQAAPDSGAKAASALQWTDSSILPMRPEPLFGADQGIGDRHTLTVLRVSLLLIVPVLAAVAVFWGAFAGRAS